MARQDLSGGHIEPFFGVLPDIRNARGARSRTLTVVEAREIFVKGNAKGYFRDGVFVATVGIFKDISKK